MTFGRFNCRFQRYFFPVAPRRNTIDKDVLTWVSTPAKSNPKGVALAGGVIILAAFSVGSLTYTSGAGVFGTFVFGAVTILFWVFNLRSFFFSTQVTLNDLGITVREPLFSRTRPWSQCKSLHLDRHGVLVSPFAFPTRLENFRGIYLRFAGNKDQVMAFCRAHIHPEGKDAASE